MVCNMKNGTFFETQHTLNKLLLEQQGKYTNIGNMCLKKQNKNKQITQRNNFLGENTRNKQKKKPSPTACYILKNTAASV